jgi:hypothetical protein
MRSEKPEFGWLNFSDSNSAALNYHRKFSMALLTDYEVESQA